MENISIKITGNGTAKEIISALKQIVSNLKAGEHVKSLTETGDCEWEDATLMTTISEGEKDFEEEISCCGWGVSDVIRIAKEDNIKLSKDEAKEVVELMERKADASLGVGADIVSVFINRWVDENRNK